MQEMELITKLLPDGWAEKAKELGAFTRRGDYIQDAEELLRILLLWSDLGSYGMTEAFLKLTQDHPMSKVAVYERVKKSEKWLQWLVQNFCYEQGYATEKPEYLKEYRVLLTDATKVSRQGSRTADFVLHSLVELFTLTPAELHQTDASCGETIANFDKIRKNDLAVGDRAYSTITGIKWMENRDAYYVFRFRANSFALYRQDTDGRYAPFDLTEQLGDRSEGKTLDLDLFCKTDDHYTPVRICAKAKPSDAIEKGLKQIKKSNRGKTRGKVTPLQAVYNQYIVLVTNLPQNITTEQILELYRIRWQIELVFKRLKSVIKYDELLTKKDSSSNAWFWCKLLMAAVCESYVSQALFSPGEADDQQYAAVVMAGIRNCLYIGNLVDL